MTTPASPTTPPRSVGAGIADDVGVLVERVAPLPMDGPDRTTWMYWPREMTADTYSGRSLADLDVDGRFAVLRLLGRFLDDAAMSQVAAVMALEIPLDQMEQYRRTHLRAMDRYWLALFGDPPSGVWGFQFEGHHVSVNVTLRGEAVMSTTPLFLGANPAVIRRGSDVVSRPCGPEEDRARRLLDAIGPRHDVVLSAEAPADIVTTRRAELDATMWIGEPPHPLGGPGGPLEGLSAGDRRLRLDLEKPAGIARGDMPPSARVRLDELVSCYLDRFRGWLAADQRARIDEADTDAIRFAWAGSPEPGQPHYYRVHGPKILIEYDCVQDGANHVHTVFRDPERDFGLDPLRAHRSSMH